MTVEFVNSHARFKQKGFHLLSLVSKKEMTRELTDLALDIAGRKYSEVKIIPLEEAVKGSHFPTPKDKSLHAIYVKENQRHPENKKSHGYPAIPYITSNGTGTSII